VAVSVYVPSAHYHPSQWQYGVELIVLQTI